MPSNGKINLSLALKSKDELNVHLYAAIRLIFVTHRDHHYMASFANCDDSPDFKPTHSDIAAALPAVDAFPKQNIDFLEIGQITLRLNQQFASAGMLHSKPQYLLPSHFLGIPMRFAIVTLLTLSIYTFSVSAENVIEVYWEDLILKDFVVPEVPVTHFGSMEQMMPNLNQ